MPNNCNLLILKTYFDVGDQKIFSVNSKEKLSIEAIEHIVVENPDNSV